MLLSDRLLVCTLQECLRAALGLLLGKPAHSLRAGWTAYDSQETGRALVSLFAAGRVGW